MMLSLSLLMLIVSAGALELVASPDRPTALYRAPAPYSRPGRGPLNSVIITSRPIAVDTETSSNQPPTQWRRHMSVGPVAQPQRPMPFYSLDCSDGEPCSASISLDPSTPLATFKPYSQDLLDKFMKEFRDKVKVAPSSPHSADRFNDRELLEPQQVPANRLASLNLEEADGEGGELPDHEPQEDKSSTKWDLHPSEKHNHPYDDRDGWVTLDPVPWSSSKVSKWHSQAVSVPKRPTDSQYSSSHWSEDKKPSWDQHLSKPARPTSYWDKEKPKPWDNQDKHKPWDNQDKHKPWDNQDKHKPWDNQDKHKPWENQDKPKPWDNQDKPKPWDRPAKPSWDNDRPSKPSWAQDKPSSWDQSQSDTRPSHHWDKPTASYVHKPDSWNNQNKRPDKWTNHHADIITDDRPQSWPTEHTRPSSSQHQSTSNKPWDDKYSYPESSHHPTHPDAGPGEWVLLSSTKGYSLPSKSRSGYQRAMTVRTAPIKTTRSIKLTVLPPLNGTVNMTTSHGGMLEVESTFQTVDEAHEEHRKARLLALKVPSFDDSVVSDNSTLTTNAPQKAIPSSEPAQTTSILRSQPGNRRNAMLAAVGAGMLPATMALLVPMMMGRKRRSSNPVLVPNVQDNSSRRVGTLIKRLLRK